ncbi:pyruvate, water dikinase regulatory protein [Amylolactobacillus amylophilus]|uniref:Transcriptional regulator n=2 Tax=Amylolactobacillus amylophilus DSM 20533 = JCM 1125 TaxID=1423721 RepID=A0A1L6XA19_9LACO|nr:pyruvate, water dikinase regulatory protein [Amylolactobacillus amylophilus]APT17827.1 transcriptional regulator [Amylolactobacillus amylophilus DSM 20533 = JCM 1125]KRM42883.1 hypothetical protein FD40_GL000679 [Amylolactobacillus amylophilus DSM 20533 = JCM 1125]GED79747.1 putative pyruvate, phosphate dikinase regulatory protein [Amylolactobacillus amylophilus]
MSEQVNVVIISDSVGETGFKLMQAASAQFPNTDFTFNRYPFITTMQKLQAVLTENQHQDNLLIAHTLLSKELNDEVFRFGRANKVKTIDLITDAINVIGKLTNEKPSGESGAIHHLTQKYFDRISAMEFAVMYDDGKDPKGFLKADVVLLGVSRTSKTPLSLFLANKNLKVANLPLVPQAHIPDEIFKINPTQIIGLTNDPAVLNRIRRERMKAYGLNPDTSYSNMNEINAELKFAQELYDKLGCYVINVANRSIEETAALIMAHLGIDDFKQQL